MDMDNTVGIVDLQIAVVASSCCKNNKASVNE